jgi:hypothetical protein
MAYNLQTGARVETVPDYEITEVSRLLTAGGSGFIPNSNNGAVFVTEAYPVLSWWFTCDVGVGATITIYTAPDRLGTFGAFAKWRSFPVYTNVPNVLNRLVVQAGAIKLFAMNTSGVAIATITGRLKLEAV